MVVPINDAQGKTIGLVIGVTNLAESTSWTKLARPSMAIPGTS
jgi:hypothetical protein